jgi:hypothetical protein
MKHLRVLALFVVTGTSVALAQGADLSAVYNGSASWHPQTVAQERANHMARLGLRGHLGSGHVATSYGYLSEGTGWGWGVMPETCVATNGTAAVADAVAYDGRGNVYRVRLYNSPGTMQPGTAAPSAYGYGYNYGRATTYAPYGAYTTTPAYTYTAAPGYAYPAVQYRR